MGYVFAISFSTFLMLSLVPQIQIADAGGKSPYESGYDHGCDDADEDFNDRYINQPERGPSFHTEAFMRGYNAGFNDCSGGDDGNDGNEGTGSSGRDSSGGGSGGVNWEQACIKYGDRIGISSDRCSQYAHGTQLTQAGKDSRYATW